MLADWPGRLGTRVTPAERPVGMCQVRQADQVQLVARRRAISASAGGPRRRRPRKSDRFDSASFFLPCFGRVVWAKARMLHNYALASVWEVPCFRFTGGDGHARLATGYLPLGTMVRTVSYRIQTMPECRFNKSVAPSQKVWKRLKRSGLRKRRLHLLSTLSFCTARPPICAGSLVGHQHFLQRHNGVRIRVHLATHLCPTHEW
jgi:hypothetical protein